MPPFARHGGCSSRVSNTATKEGDHLLAGATLAPDANAGFCCPTVQAIKLVADASSPFKLRGRAEIDQCYGMSFLRVTVEGNAPDGTGMTPGFQSLEPYLGNAFTMTRRHGESVSGLDGILDNITGRTLVIFDAAFNVLLAGTF